MTTCPVCTGFGAWRRDGRPAWPEPTTTLCVYCRGTGRVPVAPLMGGRKR